MIRRRRPYIRVWHLATHVSFLLRPKNSRQRIPWWVGNARKRWPQAKTYHVSQLRTPITIATVSSTPYQHVDRRALYSSPLSTIGLTVAAGLSLLASPSSRTQGGRVIVPPPSDRRNGRQRQYIKINRAYFSRPNSPDLALCRWMSITGRPDNPINAATAIVAKIDKVIFQLRRRALCYFILQSYKQSHDRCI